MKFYKVLKKKDGKLYSATTAFRTKDLYGYIGIEYRKRIINRPHPNGNQFLFIFCDLNSAKNFVGDSISNYEIWEIKTRELVKDYAISGVMGGYYSCYGADFPTDTRFCRSLKLIKKI